MLTETYEHPAIPRQTGVISIKQRNIPYFRSLGKKRPEKKLKGEKYSICKISIFIHIS